MKERNEQQSSQQSVMNLQLKQDQESQTADYECGSSGRS